MASEGTLALLEPTDRFVDRHLGPRTSDVGAMLKTVGVDSLEALTDLAVPSVIRTDDRLDVAPGLSESEALQLLREYADRNLVNRSFIGMGYYGTVTPPVIQRNILENPGWYTQYTPYQAEIAQGRLEALLNFQTMVGDLTGLPVANSSLLDEATAAAEAMAMCHNILRGKRNAFFVSEDIHPQTLAVVQTRAEVLGLEIRVGDAAATDLSDDALFGVLLQYPASSGRIVDYRDAIEKAHSGGALVTLATDLLALTELVPPGELGADIAVGSAQRLGVPMGYGGPHAGFLSTSEKHKRQVPGRIVGVSKDAQERPALRLAMQTREQHIRREKATSNICTAQVLLAVMAGMYAVYHGPEGLRRIARRIRIYTESLRRGLVEMGCTIDTAPVFDTLTVGVGGKAQAVLAAASDKGINLRPVDGDKVGVSLDETAAPEDLENLLAAFGNALGAKVPPLANVVTDPGDYPQGLARTSEYLTHPVFNSHHSETQLLRYMHQLEVKDLSLNTSMIPLGSCTMKLNATAQMLPVTWPEIGALHPFVPDDQATGYRDLFADLESMIATITGLPAVSLQPNAGSQGELTGLLVIRAYHRDRGDTHRTVCLIPSSAHGTNPASAVMAGMKVVVVRCDDAGNIDVEDLKARAEEHSDNLAALMVTYPSTHGVFEESIKDICAIVHDNGGQVYMDGANLNAQVGLTTPAACGADVCHLNLHKTFSIPHGGGGPGMGPIAGAKHLGPYMPGHPVVKTGGAKGVGAVAAAPWGSPSILTISWMYMKLLGGEGMTRATRVAILNANYMARKLENHYPILYRGTQGQVAHEFIIDLRPFKEKAGVTVDDVAKRLMDFGFHAPTMSWPVAGTMMIEPTESESKEELDRFCDAMIAIKGEIDAIAGGSMDPTNNPLKNAPHTATEIASSDWDRPYSREQGAYPAPWLKAHKYWPPVARVDNAYGDRHLVCSCPPLESYA